MCRRHAQECIYTIRLSDSKQVARQVAVRTLRRSLPAKSTSTSLPYFFMEGPAVTLEGLLPMELPRPNKGMVSNWRVMMQ